MSWILNLINTHGVASMFLGGLVEEIIIPIPSPLVSISGGVFLVKEKFFWPAMWSILTKVSLPFAVGATIGASFAYFLAYFGGKFLVERMEKFLGFSWKAIEKMQARYIRGSSDEIAILILRAIPVVPVSLISAVFGSIRYNLKSFYVFTFFGLVLRSLILGFIGWQAEHAYEGWVQGLNRAESIISLVLVLFLGGILAFLYKKREKFFK